MIRPVNEIPKNSPQKRQAYRQMIRDDIQEAMDKGYSKFEFEGDYNYKYLAQYAREEASNIFRKIYYPIARKIEKQVKAELGIDYVFSPSSWVYENRHPLIKIYSITAEDRKHVYAEIDHNVLDQLEDLLYMETKERNRPMGQIEYPDEVSD